VWGRHGEFNQRMTLQEGSQQAIGTIFDDQRY
jgi:hypothetical protein